GVVGRTSSVSVLLCLGIRDMSGYGVSASSNTLRIDRRGVVFAGDSSTISAPGIVQSMFRVEIAGARTRGHRFTLHDFRMIHRARCGHRHRRGTPKVKDHTCAQPHTLIAGSAQIRLAYWYFLGKILPGPLVVSLDQSDGELLNNRDINPASQNRADPRTRRKIRKIEMIGSEQRMREQIDTLATIGKAGTN